MFYFFMAIFGYLVGYMIGYAACSRSHRRQLIDFVQAVSEARRQVRVDEVMGRDRE